MELSATGAAGNLEVLFVEIVTYCGRVNRDTAQAAVQTVWALFKTMPAAIFAMSMSVPHWRSESVQL